jgi:hypothetical protein
MHYLFFDESYHEAFGRREITVAAWAVDQARLNLKAHRLAELFKTPILEQIMVMLADLDAFALIAKASLEKSVFRTGEIDGTSDIPRMARADNIWSICVTFTVGSLILQLIHKHQIVGTLDVYFDPRNLKYQHAQAWENLMRDMLVSEARRFAVQTGAKSARDIRIRRLQAIVKPPRGQAADKLQMETWIADKLCSAFSGKASPDPTPRVKTYDMSDEIRRTIQQMDGKSYYDD